MIIKLKVHPGSKKPALLKKSADSYEIWVKAPAENGRANVAALDALSTALGENPKRLRIIKGATSPHKLVSLFESR